MSKALRSKTRLFRVAKVDEIKPGHRKVVNIEGREVAVVNLNGRFYAMDNRCPHAGFPLTYAPIYKGMIICPNHGWMFSAETGECKTNPSCRLKTYKVLTNGKYIKVEL
ncbi:Assimilatory nitrite reductase [NAD(P)H] small subunit [bacterium HR37]|nr:Assimilatory nitrite reductase [NAD(P)H] small subunit [bacterium HR37]